MPALIPIQFTLESAVFDNRRIATKHAAGGVDPDIFVKEALGKFFLVKQKAIFSYVLH